MLVRRLLITAVASAVAVTAFTVPALASSRSGGSANSGSTNSQLLAAQKHTEKHNEKPRSTPFAVVGVSTAVDVAAGTITLVAVVGTSDLYGKSITATVTNTTRVTLDGSTATLADLATGQLVTVTGTRLSGTFTTKQLRVRTVLAPTPGPTPSPTSPSPTSPSPTTSAAPTSPAPTTSAAPTTSPTA